MMIYYLLGLHPAFSICFHNWIRFDVYGYVILQNDFFSVVFQRVRVYLHLKKKLIESEKMGIEKRWKVQ